MVLAIKRLIRSSTPLPPDTLLYCSSELATSSVALPQSTVSDVDLKDFEGLPTPVVRICVPFNFSTSLSKTFFSTVAQFRKMLHQFEKWGDVTDLPVALLVS